MMVFGALASAATAFIGAPLTMVAKAGPPPSAMSMPSAASACIILASPPNALISTSRPCFLKMPASTPMSAGTKANWLGWALPTRSLVSAPAAPQASIKPATAARASAAGRSPLNVIGSSLWRACGSLRFFLGRGFARSRS